MLETLRDCCVSYEQLRELFPYMRPSLDDRLLDKLKSVALFRYGQCDIKVPERLGVQFAIFLPIFRNTSV